MTKHKTGTREEARSADRAGGRGVLLRVDRVRNSRPSAGGRAGGGRDAVAGADACRSDRGRCGRPDRRRAPVHRVEGTSPCLLPGGTRARPYVAGRLRHGLATRPPLQPLLCQSDGDPPGNRVMDLRAMAVVAAAIAFERLVPAGRKCQQEPLPSWGAALL